MEWVTTTQVLNDLKTSRDAVVWTKFRDNFSPVIFNFAKSLGLHNTDAEDVVQETMLAFIKAYRQGSYDREKGHLGQWLFGIARRVILNSRRKMPREHLVADNSGQTDYWDNIADNDAVRNTWESQWQEMVLQRCMQQARREFDPKVFMAFELYALCQKSVDEVCQQLSMSPNAVYIAKSRVLAKLRQLQQDFEQPSEGVSL